MNEEEPYIIERKVEEIRKYNPNYGDKRICICGHPYYRHFDSCDDMNSVGCKYCGCYVFEENSVVEELISAINGLISLVWKNTCSHEDTHRGGSIWEICDQCGAMWADDEGGRPEFVEPKEITVAEELIKRIKS